MLGQSLLGSARPTVRVAHGPTLRTRAARHTGQRIVLRGACVWSGCRPRRSVPVFGQRLLSPTDSSVSDRPAMGGAAQETFPISFCWVGLVSGVATTSHAVPFSARPASAPSCPTVEQFELLTHSTPPRMLTELGFGVGTMDHVDPFQCSASVWSVVFVPFPNPVAQQSTLLTQSTPLNAFNVDALGSGVGTMTACPVPVLGQRLPTEGPEAD